MSYFHTVTQRTKEGSQPEKLQVIQFFHTEEHLFIQKKVQTRKGKGK